MPHQHAPSVSPQPAREVAGVAEILALGDRRRSRRWTTGLALATITLVLSWWCLDEFGPILVVMGWAVAVPASMLIWSRYRGPRVQLQVRRDHGLSHVPEPIASMFPELGTLRAELGAVTDGSRSAPPELMMRCYEWLERIEGAPELAREWLAQRGAHPGELRSCYESWLKAPDERQQDGTLQALCEAIDDFRWACTRTRAGMKPSEAGPEGTEGATVLTIFAWLLVVGFTGEWMAEMNLTFFEGCLLAGIGGLPVLSYVLGALREHEAWARLRAAVGGRGHQPAVERALAWIRGERWVDHALTAAIVLTASASFVLVLFDETHPSDEELCLATMAPSLALAALCGLRSALNLVELKCLRLRAGLLLWVASLRGRDSEGLRALLLAVVVLGPRLASASVSEQARYLETIGARLLAARRLPPAQRAELHEAGFDLEPSLTLLRRGLERGGLVSRAQIRELGAQLMSLRRALWAAQLR